MAATAPVSAKEHEGQGDGAGASMGHDGANQAIDGAVDLRDAEEIGDTRQQHHDVDRKAAHDLPERHAREQHANGARGGEHQDAEVHLAHGRDCEHRNEDRNRADGCEHVV